MAPKINYNTKHLGQADPLPPFSGKLRVYNMRFCPYAHRAILVLNAKQVDYEVVNIDLRDKPEWFPTKSRHATVPSLEVLDGVTIGDSLVASEYLDDVYAQRPLLPKDPLKKAQARLIAQESSTIASFIGTIIRNPQSITEGQIAGYRKYLTFIQDELKKRGTKFLGGSEPDFADYMIWPWFERILAYFDRFPYTKIDMDEFKLLWEYINNMFKDPAVAAYRGPTKYSYKSSTAINLAGGPTTIFLLENEQMLKY